MKLTEKDKEFLESLKRLMESKDLSLKVKPRMPSYIVLIRTNICIRYDFNCVGTIFANTDQSVDFMTWFAVAIIMFMSAELLVFRESSTMIFQPPALRKNLRLPDCTKDLSVQKLFTQGQTRKA